MVATARLDRDMPWEAVARHKGVDARHRLSPSANTTGVAAIASRHPTSSATGRISSRECRMNPLSCFAIGCAKAQNHLYRVVNSIARVASHALIP